MPKLSKGVLLRSYTPLFALLMLFFPFQIFAADLAQSLFKQYRAGVLQVRVIDLASGEKSSIGSGFSVQPDGLIVSNYHVVASFVEHPDKYRLEFAGSGGKIGALQLLDVDVINDLSILKFMDADHHAAKARQGKPVLFTISNMHLSKGADIFSMGNPLDLGMTIIEGIYNGQPEHSLYQRILFSGSLNPGMSGGPALDRNGDVIGVNVSTAGNEISFLVPALYLQSLIERVRDRGTEVVVDFKARIEAQLFEHQHGYIAPLLAKSWQGKLLAERVKTPERIADFMKCWGYSGKKKDAMYENVSRSCSNQEAVYLGPWFRTGKISYDFQLLKDKSLGTLRFYTMYQDSYESARTRFGHGGKDKVTDLECNTDFIRIHHRVWKISFCSRRYKEYKSLYDMSLSMAMTGDPDQGMIANLMIAGCGKDDGLKLAEKFMESIQWQP